MSLEKRTLGSRGPLVPVIGLGCNNFGLTIDFDAARRVVDAAIDNGVWFFDTADSYGRKGGSERMLGEILGSRRSKVVIATKFGMPMDEDGEKSGASRKYVFEAVEASLKRLNTDYIDLYQLHRPDEATPIEETMEALHSLIAQGKVRFIGCSNLPASMVQAANRTAEESGASGFCTGQYEYSLLRRHAEESVLPSLEAEGMSLLPYFPLANGLLTGKYRLGETPEGGRLSTMKEIAKSYLTAENLVLAERLAIFAEERGRTLLELAFGWLLSNRSVASVIAGATKSKQVEENVLAADWRIDDADLRAVTELLMAP
ncbi:MAG: aldo/keto reductase [Amphiplicatus sp.]